MTIILYKTPSEYNVVDKTLEPLATLYGTLREESSVLAPSIVFSDIDSVALQANYAYVQEFNRYYFITAIDSLYNNMWRFSFEVDVLYTYRDAIRENYAIIERNQNEYDLKLNDGLFQTQQNPRIAQFSFPAGFNQWNFVMAIAGN